MRGDSVEKARAAIGGIAARRGIETFHPLDVSIVPNPRHFVKPKLNLLQRKEEAARLAWLAAKSGGRPLSEVCQCRRYFLLLQARRWRLERTPRP